jgi:hypothetical protein
MCRRADMCVHWALSACGCNHDIIAMVHTTIAISFECLAYRASTFVPSDVATRKNCSLELPSSAEPSASSYLDGRLPLA